ncbi:hypothetical protein V5799_018993 [Amblyomma americanum]|uniref:Uncharacterized protein n=1 Tax=Amblyomma americanum TaxID=6943 RepID=A0AAQ4EY34_AMBAM
MIFNLPNKATTCLTKFRFLVYHNCELQESPQLWGDFNLVLHPDLSAFSDDFVVTTSAGAVDVDLSHMYSGHVEEGSTGSSGFESVGFSVTQGVKVFSSATRFMRPLHAHLWLCLKQRRKRRSPDIADTPGTGTRKPRARRGKGRRGRPRQDATQRLCHLQVVVDHTLYGFFAQGTDDHTARERITSLVGTHITSTNVIYTGTDFNGIVGMRFAIQDLKINDTHVCEGRDAVSNPFCRQDLDANLMLHMFAAENRNDFCLSYAWTNRDLGEGTLGLAYLAYPNAQCPEPPHKPNLTECNHGTQVCQSGRCEGSVCQKYGYDDCQRVNTGSRTSPLEMCLVDCKRAASHCRSSQHVTGKTKRHPFRALCFSQEVHSQNGAGAGVDGPCLDTCKESALAPLCNRRRERGAACDQFRGYCDVFRRCRTVDEGGPLARLEQLFVPNRLRDWIRVRALSGTVRMHTTWRCLEEPSADTVGTACLVKRCKRTT